MTKSRGIYERHGGRRTSLYSIWVSMWARCTNPELAAYKNYGGRGIKVCEHWRKFSNFRADMGERPEGKSLERENNDKDYCKENCIWADRTTQNRNKRNNVMLTMDGETLPLCVWAERSGLRYATVHQRLRKGWTPDDAVKLPLVTRRKGIPRGQKIHAFDGVFS